MPRRAPRRVLERSGGTLRGKIYEKFEGVLFEFEPEAIDLENDPLNVFIYFFAGAGAASAVAALPDEDDTGVLVVQLAGEKAWRLEGETATEGLIFL